MYKHENNYTYQDSSYIHEQVPVQQTTPAAPKKNRILKKIMAITLSAALFGSVASGSFYGVSTLLSNVDFFQGTSNSSSALTVSSTSYSSNSGSTSQSLDVSSIASLGLSAVVSVTNISVQEVENYFGRFGMGGQQPMQTEETVSCGSGVIIYSGDSGLYMITNYHVVEDADTLSVTFVNDETYEAQLCGYDETLDLALIKVSVSELSEDTLSQISVISIGDSDELNVGEQVVAIGNALGYGQSVTTGIVSAVNRAISSEDSSTSTYIQTDAAINPGNSGGALLNMDGELIGVNTAKISSTGVEGMGYAIPISQVTEWLESLMNSPSNY